MANEIIKFEFNEIPIRGGWKPVYNTSPSSIQHNYNGSANDLRTVLGTCSGISSEARVNVTGDFETGFIAEFVEQLLNENLEPFTVTDNTLAYDGDISVETIQDGSESQNEIQRITILGNTGEFVLTVPAFGSANTGSIAVSSDGTATAIAIANAINTLAAGTAVSVTNPSAGVYDVEYINTSGLTDQALFSISSETIGYLVTITVTVLQHGSPPTISLITDTNTIAENGGTCTITAIMDNKHWPNVGVDLGFGGTAVLDEHYTITTDSIVIIGGMANGGVSLTSASMDITAIDNALNEGDLTVVVDIINITTSPGYVLPVENGTQQVTITITDDDITPPVANLSLSTTTLAENQGTAYVYAFLDKNTTASTTINLAFTGTATNNADYSRSGTSITIGSGQSSGTASVTVINDTAKENSETVIIDISSITGAGVTENGTQQVTLTITDNDPNTVSLSASRLNFHETNVSVVIVATIPSTTSDDVIVNLAFSGTATEDVDYSKSSNSILISSGQTSGSITLLSLTDAENDPDETVIVDISSITNGTENGVQQLTITIEEQRVQHGQSVGLRPKLGLGL